MPYLIIKWRGDEVQRVTLAGAMTIGREMGVELWINDPALSRKHCRIERTDDGSWQVIDLQSRNGVYIGDARVKRLALSDGDKIRAGDVCAAFHAGELKPRRSATPDEALFAMHMRPVERPATIAAEFALAAKTTQVADKPITPTRVRLSEMASEPLAQPFGLAFKRPPAKPLFGEAPTKDESADAVGESRGWFGSALSALRLLLPGKRDVA